MLRHDLSTRAVTGIENSQERDRLGLEIHTAGSNAFRLEIGDMVLQLQRLTIQPDLRCVERASAQRVPIRRLGKFERAGLCTARIDRQDGDTASLVLQTLRVNMEAWLDGARVKNRAAHQAMPQQGTPIVRPRRERVLVK